MSGQSGMTTSTDNWQMFQVIKSIEHVGSTSVNGLAAKPIIDIDIIGEDKNKLI